MKKWFLHYAYSGGVVSDTPEQRLQKAIMVVIPTAISISCLFWSSTYYYLDKPISAAIPGGYAVFSLFSTLLFFRTKNYAFYRFSQILLILLLPFLLQASLGGFRSGSAVQVWALLAPIGALMFHSVRSANFWFLSYVALTIISGLLEPTLSNMVPLLPEPIIDMFFVLNTCIAFFIVFMSVQFNVVENAHILLVVKEQTAKLQNMEKIKNRFFSNITHEFRTPLALTLGPLEDALNNEYGDINERLREQLRVMLRNSNRLLRLINQLLDISKIEADEMQVHKGKHDFLPFFEAAYQAFAPLAERKNITFEFDAHGEIGVGLYDQEKLETVISNLLSNAFKFTPDGGRIKLSVCTIHTEEGRCIQFAVKDTGSGISTDNLDKIFDRFYQVDASSTREHEGTGIGLSLAYELITLHNGDIKVNSEPGFGTEFVVRLPQPDGVLFNTPDEGGNQNKGSSIALVELGSIQGTCNTENSADNVAVGDGSAKTILIVDDNNDIRQYVSSCLSSYYQVLTENDGASGWSTAQTEHPDLIISDIMMPVMDGYEFCNNVKSHPQTQSIPFIFLTAKASDDMLVEGLEKGADDYISKPFNSKELRARVQNLLTIKQQERDLLHLNKELKQKLNSQIDELIKTRRLGSYFSESLLKKILSTDETEDMVTERRNITILFCDLCDFTETTDRLEIEKATTLLNDYLSAMTQLIEQQHGTIVQIIGDAIMVFFGAPHDMENQDQARNAVQLGISIQKEVKKLSKTWRIQGIDIELRARIGINQDYVTVGNFGSRNLMEYTAVGRGINLASRIESACTPGHIKVSQTVYMLTQDQFPFGPLEETSFKGFKRKILVSELSPDEL